MKWRKMLVVAALAIAGYGGTYCVLRLTKYFVRQDFACLSCSDSVMERIRREHPNMRHISVESQRNQVGCGRIQKDGRRFGEPVLLPLFRPLGELEMRVRGFNHSTLYVQGYVDGAEPGTGIYHTPPNFVCEFTVTRAEQVP